MFENRCCLTRKKSELLLCRAGQISQTSCRVKEVQRKEYALSDPVYSQTARTISHESDQNSGLLCGDSDQGGGIRQILGFGMGLSLKLGEGYTVCPLGKTHRT